MARSNFVVLDLGGSLIVPHLTDKGGVAVPFLRRFRSLILEELRQGVRFIIVSGGGKTARMYNRAASKIVRMTNEDLDWIGIHATRLNAHLLRTIFRNHAYPVVIDHDPSLQEVQKMKRAEAKVFIASGWRPGWSSDYDAVRLAQKFGVKSVVIAGDTPFVYDTDPRQERSAEPFTNLTWKEYRRLIPKTWKPGFSSPVDPIAARLAQEQKIAAKILKGTDFANLRRAIRGKPFTGTVISP